jgi:hypothetical protein
MKQTLLTTALLLTTVLAYAQAPQGINYQAVVRDAGGNELANQAVSLRMTILENNTTTVYQETHSAITNGFGLVNIVIGQGTATQGAFNAIDWSTGNYFAQTEVDVTGGTNYALMGSQQLMSVPYALYAESAGGASLPTGADNQTIRYNGGGWEADSLLINTGIAVGIGRQNPDDLLHIYGADPNLIIQDTETTSTLAESYAIFAESGVSGGWTSYNWKIGYDRKNFTFNYTNASTENEFMRIDPDGKVGIGTTTPQERLHVDGQIRMTTGATDGYIIQGDADGTMSWVDPGTVGSGNVGLDSSLVWLSYDNTDAKPIRDSERTGHYTFPISTSTYTESRPYLGDMGVPLNLPDSSKFVSMDVFVRDNEPGEIIATLERHSMGGITPEAIATGNSNATGETITMSFISNETIDNSLYSYRLILTYDCSGCGGPSSLELSFRNCRIQLRVPN